MRFLFLLLCLLAVQAPSFAVEMPPQQMRITADKVLRGHFTEDHQFNNASAPLHSTGHFVLAPAHGLIWGVEQPFPTSTIITPEGAAQDFGGVSLKLPAKNLRHLYDMIGGALAGDWSGLEQDYIIVRAGVANHWQMVLTPRQGGKPKLSYSTISVSGSSFVENIVLTKADGVFDAFTFTDEALTSAPLPAAESAAFNKSKP